MYYLNLGLGALAEGLGLKVPNLGFRVHPGHKIRNWIGFEVHAVY